MSHPAVKELHIRKLSELKPADYNPRELTEIQHAQIARSIKQFGLVDPLIINQHPDRLDIIVGGHQRHKVAQELGYTEAPCVYVSLPLEKEKQLNVVLNKATGQWDFDMLANNWEITELIDLGFTKEELGVGFTDPGAGGDDGPKEAKIHQCPSCGYKFQ